MKLILNAVHKLKFDPSTLDAVIKSPSGIYTDINPDICFMCQFMKKVMVVLDDSNKEIDLISCDGQIQIKLKSVAKTPDSRTLYFLTVNGEGGNVEIQREQLVALNRVLHKLYFEYAY